MSKTFVVPEERQRTLKERVLHPRGRGEQARFEVLRDISFDVYPGEFFGIAGRNGSGKSTMLKCLAGIYHATGDIWVRGRLSTLIELGVGFNMEMAARDNVTMNGIMLGLTPREARRRYDSVMDFAELRHAEDVKLKNYSSGMQIRLAFSVAIQVDADILLIDEVLAVGDAAFQQKCFDVFYDLRDRGKTIVFVTHDMGSLRRFCHRAMLLEDGDQLHLGDPSEVADRYLEINFGRAPAKSEAGDHIGDGDARVTEVWIQSEAGERLGFAAQHERVTLCVRVRFRVAVENPACSVYVHNEEHQAVAVLSTNAGGTISGDYRAGEEMQFAFTFDNVLAPGRYSPVIQLAHRGEGLDVMDRFEGAFSFIVTGSMAQGGLVDMPAVIRTGRVDAQAEAIAR